MKKISIILTVFIVILVLVGYITLSKQKNVPPRSTVQEIDASWNEYTNYDLGFSLRIPKISYRFLGFDRSMERTAIPIKVIEDPESDDVYVTDEWTIDREGKKIKNVTLEDLRNQNPVSWKIMLQNVAGEEDIRAFIKKRYYSGCDLLKITQSKEVEGLFDVETTWSSPDTSEQDYCFINWRTVNKYSPERHLIASWDMGQDVNFMGSNQEAYDDAMVASFRFLKK